MASTAVITNTVPGFTEQQSGLDHELQMRSSTAWFKFRLHSLGPQALSLSKLCHDGDANHAQLWSAVWTKGASVSRALTARPGTCEGFCRCWLILPLLFSLLSVMLYFCYEICKKFCNYITTKEKLFHENQKT